MQGKNCNLLVGNKSVAFLIIANEQPHEARREAARRQHDKAERESSKAQ